MNEERENHLIALMKHLVSCQNDADELGLSMVHNLLGMAILQVALDVSPAITERGDLERLLRSKVRLELASVEGNIITPSWPKPRK